MKEKLNSILNWANSDGRPKKFFYIFLGLIILSTVFNIIKEVYFPSKIDFTTIPSLYAQSDKTKEEINLKEQKLEQIVKELKQFKAKNEKQELSAQDSIRVEYLYNEYKKIKDGL